MSYRYRAYTARRETIEGTVEAASEKMAEEALYQGGVQYVLSLKAAGAGMSAERLVPTLFGIKPQDVIDFSRQLAAFTESGVSLLAALQLLVGQVKKPAMRRLLDEVVAELQGGSSFSAALGRRPDAFPYSYTQVVRASEQAGDLETGLRQVADYMERQLLTASRIRRALSYPAFVVLIAIGVFSLMVTLVLPPMVQLFTSFDVALPWTTRAVIWFTRFFTAYKFHLLVGIIAALAAFLGYSRLESGKRTLDRLALRLPLIGTVVLQRAMGQFCRTASMLLRSGLQLPKVLEVGLQTTGSNRLIRASLTRLRDKLVQGEGLSGPLNADPLFPSVMAKMVAMAEQTGTVDTAFGTLADYFETQSNQRVQTLVSLIEPTLTIGIGIMVAFMLLAIILPLYSILGAIR